MTTHSVLEPFKVKLCCLVCSQVRGLKRLSMPFLLRAACPHLDCVGNPRNALVASVPLSRTTSPVHLRTAARPLIRVRRKLCCS
eukprot:6041584-Alexandrium_andersonii.AAC.1